MPASKTQFSGDFRTLGFEWSDIRNASMRQKLLSEWDDEKRKFQDNRDAIMRNSMIAEQKVLEKVRKSPIRNQQSPLNRSQTYHNDPKYSKYRTDAHINKEILKERMSSKNIKKNVKSRVSYHWDKKRQKEMKTESDYMSGYYAYGIIYEILRDMNLRRVTYEDAKAQLEQHGYNLKANDSQATQKYKVSPLRNTRSSNITDEDAKRVQLKEHKLCVKYLRNAAIRITDQSLIDLINDKNLSTTDQELTKIFVNLLEIVDDGKMSYYPLWSNVQSELVDTNKWIVKIDSFESLIDNNGFPEDRIDGLKDNFTKFNEEISGKPYVTNIKDFLSEAFVFIEIVNDLKGLAYPSEIDSNRDNHSTFDRHVIENASSEIQSVFPVVAEEINTEQVTGYGQEFVKSETAVFSEPPLDQKVQVIRGKISTIKFSSILYNS